MNGVLSKNKQTNFTIISQLHIMIKKTEVDVDEEVVINDADSK